MKKLTFEEYISDYQIVSHKNIDLLDECGLSENDLTEETIFSMASESLPSLKLGTHSTSCSVMNLTNRITS